MPAYFRKSLPQTLVQLSNGKRFRFEQFPDGYGYLTTSDESLIADFRKCIQDRKFGISEISLEDYDAAIKKNATTSPPEKPQLRSSAPKLVNMWPPHRRQQAPTQAQEAAAAASADKRKVASAPQEVKVKPGMPSAALRGAWRPKTDKMVADQQ
jgi:hypothetical protein